MRITDLTHLICPDMPVFPGTEPPVFREANTLEKNGFIEAEFTMYSHTGTHMDAPAHLFREGLTLDRMGVNRFIGRAVILDFQGMKGKLIKRDSMVKYQQSISRADFVIIKTGWSKYWGVEQYFDAFPSLSIDSAEWLAGFNLKGVGVDAISIDDINSVDFPVHKLFLKKNIVIIENLTNLDLIRSELFILSAMPIKNRNADGSPVRAVAIEMET